MNVTDNLVIFWNTPEGQYETDGIYLYGLMPPNPGRYRLGSVTAPWKPVSVQCKESNIESKRGPVLVVTIKFDTMPNAMHWYTNLESALTSLLDIGAIVAWAGGEDCTWSPDVLDPKSGAGNVLAAKSTSTGFLCNANINEPIKFLDDSQLAALWSFVEM
jgi:hypothetical protein